MITIRQNVFETNSSSTHSVVVASDDEWKDFFDRKTLYNIFSSGNDPEGKDPEYRSNNLPRFVTVAQVLEYASSLGDSLNDIIFDLSSGKARTEVEKEELDTRRWAIWEKLLYMPESFIGLDSIQNLEAWKTDAQGNLLPNPTEDIDHAGTTSLKKGQSAYGFDHYFG